MAQSLNDVIAAARPHAMALMSAALEFRAEKGDGEAAKLKDEILGGLQGNKGEISQQFMATMVKFNQYAEKHGQEMLDFVSSRPELQNALHILNETGAYIEQASRQPETAKELLQDVAKALKEQMVEGDKTAAVPPKGVEETRQQEKQQGNKGFTLE